MIAEIFPQAYDTEGRPTFRPDQKRRSRFPSTFPFGSYVSQPLAVKCNSLEDLRVFLRKCRYVSDEEQFGKKEYWMPPQDFERSRKGDCEDFSLYAWRQLLDMGYKARFVGGTVGDSPAGHAWVTFQKDGKHYLLEPQHRYIGLKTGAFLRSPGTQLRSLGYANSIACPGVGILPGAGGSLRRLSSTRAAL